MQKKTKQKATIINKKKNKIDIKTNSDKENYSTKKSNRQIIMNDITIKNHKYYNK